MSPTAEERADTYIERGAAITKAMRRIWRLQDRPDPFANDRGGAAGGWEAFGLLVAAAIESPEPNQPTVMSVAARWHDAHKGSRR